MEYNRSVATVTFQSSSHQPKLRLINTPLFNTQTQVPQCNYSLTTRTSSTSPQKAASSVHEAVVPNSSLICGKVTHTLNYKCLKSWNPVFPAVYMRASGKVQDQFSLTDSRHWWSSFLTCSFQIQIGIVLFTKENKTQVILKCCDLVNIFNESFLTLKRSYLSFFYVRSSSSHWCIIHSLSVNVFIYSKYTLLDDILLCIIQPIQRQ